MITILTKTRGRRVVQTDCIDSVGLGKHLEGDNYLASVSGDSILNPTPKPVLKEKMSFFDRKELKRAKKEWKSSIINKYPQESGTVYQIWKNHLQINEKFNCI